MKIRDQFVLSAALFGVMLLVIAVSVVTTTAELDRLDRQVQIADRIGLAANDLNYLSSEYLLYGEPQQLDRWERRSASLDADLTNLSAGSPDRQALIAAIGEDRGRLKSVFDDVLAQNDTPPQAAADPASLRVSWSRIGIQTQGVAFDAARLAALLRDEADGLQFVNTLLISALLGTFAAALLINYLAVGRRTLRSVAALQAGADAIGAGDLGHAIPAAGDDEVGDLARSFNRMATDLETVTASRAELEREMASRRLAEQAVREREQTLQSVFRAAPVGIGISSHRVIRSVNDHLGRMTGHAPDELLGRDTRMLYLSDEAYTRVGEERYAQILENGIGAVETQWRRKDGEVIDVLLSSSPMDPSAPEENVVFVALDITNLHEKEAALRESEARFRAFMDNSPAIAWMKDEQGRHVYLNRTYLDRFTVLPGDRLGKTDSELWPPDVARQFQENDRIVLTTGQAIQVIEETPNSDGGPTFWWNFKFPLQDDSGKRYVGGMGIDVTERREAEETLKEYAEDLKRSNEDLERFAYVSSHDLQEPLRSIVSFSQLLERRYRGRLDSDADEYIDFIVEGGTRMQTLIQDLLAYSRVNTTKQELTRTDTADVLASVERHLDVQLREAGATITHDPMPVVLADPLQIEQVLTNLVSNAIKFRRPGEPLRIHVGARRMDGFWEFSVSDNGIGIAPEYFDRIFVIFQRLHTKDAYPGTGIGLAIVKRIVDRHGGQIRVESTPGEGSTFSFTLPAA